MSVADTIWSHECACQLSAVYRRLLKRSAQSILYNSPPFIVYTDNNSLTYILSTAKLNATGSRWVEELSDFDFEIKCRPEKVNLDADSLSRIPGDFQKYMDCCTQSPTQEFDAPVSHIRSIDDGNAAWMAR